MAMEPAPDVQSSSARHLLREGRTVELVFHHGNHANMENLTPGQARALQMKLQTFLWELRVQEMEKEADRV